VKADANTILQERGPSGLRAEFDNSHTYGEFDRCHEKAKVVAPTSNPITIHWHGEPDDAPLRGWLVDKMLPRVGTALLAGQWGVYKTFVALDLAASIMVKSDFAGRRVDRQGGTLFMAVEGQNEVRLRLQAVINEKVKPVQDDAENSVLIDAAHAPFAWMETCPVLASQLSPPSWKGASDYRSRSLLSTRSALRPPSKTPTTRQKASAS
jgi:hypothetical protein